MCQLKYQNSTENIAEWGESARERGVLLCGRSRAVNKELSKGSGPRKRRPPRPLACEVALRGRDLGGATASRVHSIQARSWIPDYRRMSSLSYVD